MKQNHTSLDHPITTSHDQPIKRYHETMLTVKSCALVACQLFLACVSGVAQEALHERLAGKDKLPEIMSVVDNYFAEFPEPEGEFESDYLRWKRWEWYVSSRTGRDGALVNIPERMIKGLAEKEKMSTSMEDRNINSNWTQVGPSSSPLQNPTAQYNGLGRINKAVFHPTNDQIIYLCTPNGGLWQSLNEGETWINLTDHLPSIGIAGCVVSYADPNTIYLLTGDGRAGFNSFGYGQPSVGILRSTDNGASWHSTGALPNAGTNYYGNALEQSPTNPNTLVVATNVGLYRTTDGGNTWTQEETGHFQDVKFKPGDGNIIYATKQGRMFYRSTDGGDTWATDAMFNIGLWICDGFGGDRILIGVAPTNVSKVYLLSAPRLAAGSFCGTWLSTDSGASFTRQTTFPNIYGTGDDGSDDTDFTGYCMAFTCSSNNSFDIFAGGCTIWRSQDGGDNWDKVTSYNEGGSFPYIHPDVHGLSFNPLNNKLYASTDGGIYVSADFGDTWEDLTTGVETTQCYHMAGWDGNINKLLIGSQDNGVKYRKDNTTSFYHIIGGDGFDVAFNQVTGRPAYSSVNDVVVKYTGDGVSAGVTDIDNQQWFKPLAAHNTDTNIIMAGAGEGIFRSLDNGANWTNEGASGSWSLTSCPSNNSRFYATGGENFQTSNGGLYLSNNTGDTWTIKSTNSGFPDQSLWNKITDVAVNPLNSIIVYASFGGFEEGVKVVRSTNTGDTWTDLSLNLPNVPINCLAVDNSDGVYAGTDIGVFYKSATMTQWMPWSNGMPNVPVTELVIYDDGTTKRLRAATYGRGVWQSDLAQTCDASVVVIGSLQGIRHYEASTAITSPAFVQGGEGTFVSFQSGDYITLSEGFRVIDESEFLGYISPCGQGGIPGLHDMGGTDRNASVIPMRRMWDPETGLPYGSIHTVQITGGQCEVTFEINQPGSFEIVLARPVQEAFIPIAQGDTTEGKHTMRASLDTVDHAFYHVLLFYNGKLVHFQELDLREK
jgi:photosystem II stability/assembly factor-like uncharacterized protein